MSESSKQNEEKVYVPKSKDKTASKGYSREQILATLHKMPPEKLNWVIFFLRIPKTSLPSPTEPQYDRAQAVLQYVEQPDGVGIDRLAKALVKAVPRLMAGEGATADGNKSSKGVYLIGVAIIGIFLWLGKGYVFPSAKCGDNKVQSGEQCDGSENCTPDCILAPSAPVAIAPKLPESTPTIPPPKPAPEPVSVPSTLQSTPTTQPEPKPSTPPTPKPTNTVVGTLIRFIPLSAGIEEEFLARLDDVAAAMLENNSLKIRLEGHTDSEGVASTNVALSKKRADKVLRYLASKGVPRTRMSAVGCGSSFPMADNTSEEGKSLNRRVEIVDAASKICGIR